MDLDYRLDLRDGEYKLLDFNPRLGAQFRLFTDDTGVDVAVAAHLDLTGREIPPGRPVDRGFLVENYDPIAAAGYWRRGELDLRAWLRSLHEVDELAWFARDDLRPFGLMCARLGWRVLRRPFPQRGRPGTPAPPRYRPGRAEVRHTERGRR
jgi:predicted ATP-grasp superfamily ATP-dependent carboligase